MSDEKKFKVLIVDDEKVVRDFLVRLLSLEAIEVKAVEDGFQAIEAAKQEKFDLFFLDIRMPKMNGLEAYSELKKLDPNIRCIFMTGYALEATLLDKTKQPGMICLRKPFENINQIKEILNNALQESRLAKESKPVVMDRRAYVRLEIALEVDYKLKEKEGPFIRGFSEDISPLGIELLIQEELACGAILNMVLRAPGYAKTCAAAGEVIWCKEIEDKSGYYDAGIKFSEINLAEFTDFLISSGIIPS